MRRVTLLVGALAVAASGVLLAVASGGSALGASEATQDGLIAFTRVGPYPCGTRGDPNEQCSSNIYVARTDGTGVRPITTLAARVTVPARRIQAAKTCPRLAQMPCESSDDSFRNDESPACAGLP
jgi:hypothetical protein